MLRFKSETTTKLCISFNPAILNSKSNEPKTLISEPFADWSVILVFFRGGFNLRFLYTLSFIKLSSAPVSTSARYCNLWSFNKHEFGLFGMFRLNMGIFVLPFGSTSTSLRLSSFPTSSAYKCVAFFVLYIVLAFFCKLHNHVSSDQVIDKSSKVLLVAHYC